VDRSRPQRALIAWSEALSSEPGSMLPLAIASRMCVPRRRAAFGQRVAQAEQGRRERRTGSGMARRQTPARRGSAWRRGTWGQRQREAARVEHGDEVEDVSAAAAGARAPDRGPAWRRGSRASAARLNSSVFRGKSPESARGHGAAVAVYNRVLV